MSDEEKINDYAEVLALSWKCLHFSHGYDIFLANRRLDRNLSWTYCTLDEEEKELLMTKVVSLLNEWGITCQLQIVETTEGKRFRPFFPR